MLTNSRKSSLEGLKYSDASQVDPGAGTRHHLGLSTAPTFSPCTLYCASSWLASTATNHLCKLESQHLSGARIITECTRSTPTVPLLKKAGLIPLAVHANLAAAKLRKRALRHTQETPIANAAARLVEPHIRRHGATAISERLGLDTFPRKVSPRAYLRGAAERELPSPLTLVPWQAPQMTPN